MARHAALRWDPQRNKWKVVYRGHKYRFDGGAGRSDREAKRAADAEWKRLKADLDQRAEQSKPHRVEYEKVIEEWSSVLAWSLEHDEHKSVAVARAKIADLEARLSLRTPPPLDWADRFLAGPPPDYAANERLAPVYHEAGIPPVTVMTGPAPSFERATWADRRESRERRIETSGADNGIGTNVQAFVARKRSEAEAGQISAGRAESIRMHLEIFLQYIGRTTVVQSINHTIVAAFRDHLVERIRAEQLTAVYARDIFRTFKLFVRWLVNHTDKLEHLPKNIDERSLAISVGLSEAKTLSKESIHALLKKATDRTQLYILLGLNAAMTQQDMSDLVTSEVDWKRGAIHRKRSKTRDCKNVPTITHPLWPETFRLLQEQRAASGKHVLLNEAGGVLKSESFSTGGAFKKIDSVRSAVRRLSKVTGISFSVKALKKTAASLLRGNASYRGLESLYLDHAPATVAEKHYTRPPQELLNEAIEWLGKELGLLGSLRELPEPEVVSLSDHDAGAEGGADVKPVTAKRKRKTNRALTTA
jgi:hypothetical protein